MYLHCGSDEDGQKLNMRLCRQSCIAVREGQWR